MSYYRPSFSQTVAMTRGRGFSSSRGGSTYRGGSRGSSSWNDRGRGSYGSSSRGGSSKFSSSFSSSFDSRPRYGSSSHGTSERYSTSSRGRSDGFRRPSSSYRSEGFSGRDSSSHRSPDRKRVRTEAPSSRRSHDGGGGYGSSNDNYRYDSHNSYSDKSRNSFSASSDRRPPPFRGSRDDYRKPPSTTTRYRGRIGSRGIRGISRIGTRDGLKRRLVDNSYTIRKRIIPRPNQDYVRRIKLNRLRSITNRRPIKKSKSSDKDISDKDWEEIPEEKSLSVSKKNKNVEKEGGGGGTTDASDKDDKADRKSSPTKKSPKKEPEDDDVSDKKSDVTQKGGGNPSKRPFIHLNCPHCYSKCDTFGDYSTHLYSGKHVSAMRRIAMKQKQVLARMRLAQRNTQREVEKAGEDLAPRTNFCPLCKLNYKQLKSKHQSSEAHKSMKKFLMPYCRVCRITFKSPMLYENHICSLEHIKRKAYHINGDKASDKDDQSGNEDMNLENFMTIDSVGDVDDDEDDVTKTATIKKEPNTAEGEAAATSNGKSKEKINIGGEHVRKVDVYFCELCKMYLPRADDEAFIIAKHCSNRTHLQKYVRYKEDRELRKQAERLQRKETAEKEERKEKDKDKKDDKDKVDNEGDGGKEKKEKDAKSDEKTFAAPTSGNGPSAGKDDDEDAGEDKVWADLDKDLGDLLSEAVSGNKSSDEDEDSHAGDGERYDRFRYSKKNGEEGGEKEDKENKDVAKETKVEIKKE